MIDPLRDLGAAIGDGRLWLALAIACIAGVVLLVVGVMVGRRIGLLDPDADAAETFAVGLSLGLLTFAAVWASIASGGRSVFVPVAVSLLLAIAVGRGRPTVRLRVDRQAVAGAAAGAAFLVAIGLLYATTIAPSPRDGQQPIEFFDVGYYSVLGADLADTGRETIYSPAGFDDLAGLPEQTWYHWGELWLAAAAIDLTGVSPLHARHLIVLPLLLLAAATMAGTLVRTLVSRSREFYLLGAAAMLFLAPIPLVRDPQIEWFARSLIISITQYGLAIVAILLGIYVVLASLPTARTGRLLVGSAIGGLLLATHVGLGAIVIGAATTSVLVDVARARWRLSGPSRSSSVSPIATATAAGVMVGVVATAAWGTLTGHSLGGLASISDIRPFDPAWATSVLGTIVGAGALLTAPVAWYRIQRIDPRVGWLALVSVVAVVAGTAAWGVLVADLNTFHLMFGPVLAALTPVSVIVLLWFLDRARQHGRRSLATAILILTLGQTVLAALIAVMQLQAFGPLAYAPTPIAAITTLRDLPRDSKAAYACDAVENFAPWDASLVSIDAHTGVRMIPMCFIADRPRRILGRELDARIESPYFAVAPQRQLYANADARPPTAMVRSFLRANGIDVIYADAAHPNTLDPDAIRIASVGDVVIYRVP